jgi:hypothetical protein
VSTKVSSTAAEWFFSKVTFSPLMVVEEDLIELTLTKSENAYVE